MRCAHPQRLSCAASVLLGGGGVHRAGPDGSFCSRESRVVPAVAVGQAAVAGCEAAMVAAAAAAAAYGNPGPKLRPPRYCCGHPDTAAATPILLRPRIRRPPAAAGRGRGGGAAGGGGARGGGVRALPVVGGVSTGLKIM
eukprot:gene15585-biopygen680